MYINVEESGTKWCEVVDEILFGGRSDLSDFSSTERQDVCVSSWENTITQWIQNGRHDYSLQSSENSLAMNL